LLLSQVGQLSLNVNPLGHSSCCCQHTAPFTSSTRWTRSSRILLLLASRGLWLPWLLFSPVMIWWQRSTCLVLLTAGERLQVTLMLLLTTSAAA
jgi:hypothetical protein